MDGLLVVERMILESLQNRKRDFQQILLDTGLSEGLLRNLLAGLVQRGILTFKSFHYSLREESKQEWLKEINATENVKEEVSEMFTSVINQKFESLESRNEGLKVQKIWLTGEESKQLEVQLKSLDLFFKGVQEQRKKRPQQKGATKEKKIIFWGQTTYEDLVSGTLAV